MQGGDVPHLRRPPDGARCRGHRLGCRRTYWSRTSPPPRRRSRASPEVWAGLVASMSGRYGEHDPESYERPRRRTRPRTKDRPSYDDAVPAVVVTVDRGRYTCRLGETEPIVTAMKSRALGRKARGHGRPGAAGRRHVRCRRLAGAHRLGGRAQDRAASYGRRRRPRRARHRGQRRPARGRHRAGRPGAPAGPDRPGPGGGVRRPHGPAAVPDQGRPRRPRAAAGELPAAGGAVRRDAAWSRPHRDRRPTRRADQRAARPQRSRQVDAGQRARPRRLPRGGCGQRRDRTRSAHLRDRA